MAGQVFTTVLELSIISTDNLEFQMIFSSDKQRERDDAATLLANLAESQRALVSAGAPTTAASRKAQAALMQSLAGTLTGSSATHSNRRQTQSFCSTNQLAAHLSRQ